MPAPRRIPAQATQPGRLDNYYLSGGVQDEADRIAGEEVEKVTPTVRTMAGTNRAFMHRATHYLAEHTGIRQFLDIGSGIPAEPNLHQIAQAVAPAVKIVYVDNDPVVFTSDRRHPLEAVPTLLEALAHGSYLTISHSTADFDPEGTSVAVEVYRASGMDSQPRTRAEIVRFFDGLELLAPESSLLTDGATHAATQRASPMPMPMSVPTLPAAGNRCAEIFIRLHGFDYHVRAGRRYLL
ncbi:SAM-dependent methyltransferase [Nocardia carnea]|uniref:SAM-dependent methyltransferase n=1 Tax=Nocardia carnea TaxID=37328 RepID=UPI002456B6BF|nr:SAM-dependent methyltransferase [Nocardia carnea]